MLSKLGMFGCFNSMGIFFDRLLTYGHFFWGDTCNYNDYLENLSSKNEETFEYLF